MQTFLPYPGFEDSPGARRPAPGEAGDDRLHRSHRSALVSKDAGFYGERLDDVGDDLEYVWPVRSRARGA